MDEMAEVFPIVAGTLCGVAIMRLRTRHRLSILVATSIAIGIVAALVSGELARSAAFLLVDVPEALAAAGVGVVLVRAGWRRGEVRSRLG
jgi:hypothetical protein